MRPNPQETADLVTFTEEILNGKLHFLCRDVIRHTQTVNQIAEFLEGYYVIKHQIDCFDFLNA